MLPWLRPGEGGEPRWLPAVAGQLSWAVWNRSTPRRERRQADGRLSLESREVVASAGAWGQCPAPGGAVWLKPAFSGRTGQPPVKLLLPGLTQV